MRFKKTPAGDRMYVSEWNKKDVTYGVISIKLKNRFSQLAEAENVLIQFMQQLQPAFAIQHSTGAAVENDIVQTRTAVVDYWQDADRRDWKVKGWTDGATLSVFYIKNIGCIPVQQEERFLNSASFPRR
jgi:hypothetical protein